MTIHMADPNLLGIEARVFLFYVHFFGMLIAIFSPLNKVGFLLSQSFDVIPKAMLLCLFLFLFPMLPLYAYICQKTKDHLIEILG